MSYSNNPQNTGDRHLVFFLNYLLYFTCTWEHMNLFSMCMPGGCEAKRGEVLWSQSWSAAVNSCAFAFFLGWEPNLHLFQKPFIHRPDLSILKVHLLITFSMKSHIRYAHSLIISFEFSFQRKWYCVLSISELLRHLENRNDNTAIIS